MTLLTSCQRVCSTVGMPRPSAVASSTDQLAQMLFGLACDEVEELSKARDWPALQRTGTITTIIDQTDYALASVATDYRNIIQGTAYRSEDYARVRGLLTPRQWARQRITGLATLAPYGFRVVTDADGVRSFQLNPAPTVAEDLTFEYRTSNYVRSAGGDEQAEFQADTDAPIVNELLFRMGLKWRIKHAKGLDYGEDYNQYEQARDRDFAGELALDEINVGETPYAPFPDTGYVREDRFGS